MDDARAVSDLHEHRSSVAPPQHHIEVELPATLGLSQARTDLVASDGELLLFERLIAQLAANLVRVRDEDIDAEIDTALQQLGRFLAIDRVCLIELTDDNRLRILKSWADHGIPELAGDFPLGDYPSYRDRVVKDVVVVRRSELLKSDPTIYELAVRADVQSHLSVPLRLGGTVFGTLSLSAIRFERNWPDELVEGLRFVADIFSSAIGRKRAVERVRRQQTELAHVARVARLGELAAIIAHELNQPLTAILTNAQATRRFAAAGKQNSAETDEALEDIVKDARRGGEIIHKLRHLLRKGEPSRALLDVRQLLTEIEPILRAALREYEVTLRLDLSEQCPPVVGDSVELQQVLLNLCDNAYHAMQACPRGDRLLSIRVRAAANDAVIEVSDNGAPIGESTFNRMFEAFFTTKSTGLGMGLSISRSIVESHHGRLFATRNPDRGITMHLILPVA